VLLSFKYFSEVCWAWGCYQFLQFIDIHIARSVASERSTPAVLGSVAAGWLTNSCLQFVLCQRATASADLTASQSWSSASVVPTEQCFRVHLLLRFRTVKYKNQKKSVSQQVYDSSRTAAHDTV
jgi:hypothetical protein